MVESCCDCVHHLCVLDGRMDIHVLSWSVLIRPFTKSVILQHKLAKIIEPEKEIYDKIKPQ